MAMLTKSNYLIGLQCPKLLWITKNNKERIPENNELTQKRFDDGTLIGVLATRLFSNGISLADQEFNENLIQTKKLLGKGVPLFEPSFYIDHLFSRADILNPIDDEWDIIEVKSSTKVKEINLHDVAFQKYVYEKAGLKIRKCLLMYINNKYIREKKIDPKKLFILEDISERVKSFSRDLELNIKKMFEIIKGPEPDFSVDDYLTIEYDNFCLDEFLNSQQENNIFELYRIFKKDAVKLYKLGYKTIKDLPDSISLNEKQLIQRKLCFEKSPHLNKSNILSFLNNLKYPIYYLDFETINPVLPKFTGMKPYQRIPFQFSLHIQNEKNKELKHISFLADGKTDPRKEFMQALKNNLGEKGTILVYNQCFENSVLKECTNSFPEFKKWYEDNILKRIKDLWNIFKDFDFYDSRQKGSTSIKYVLPCFSDLSYNDLKFVQKGDEASYQWERITFSDVDLTEKQNIREALEEYCKLDTLAEAEILKNLYKLTED